MLITFEFYHFFINQGQKSILNVNIGSTRVPLFSIRALKTCRAANVQFIWKSCCSYDSVQCWNICSLPYFVIHKNLDAMILLHVVVWHHIEVANLQ